VILNSLADLDIHNPTLLSISREKIVRILDAGQLAEDQDNQIMSPDQEVKPLIEKQQEQLKPVGCAQFMTAFVRGEMFKEVALFERLEARFIERIDEAGGPTLVTMFQAHGAWAAHVVDEVLVKKKQKKRVYKIFKKYHDLFYEHCVVNLIKKADEINLKGFFLVLVHGNVTSLKLRHNLRVMQKFAVRGVEALKTEREACGKDFEPIVAKYYDISSRYCLNQEAHQ